jgi:hypothetical protein
MENFEDGGNTYWIGEFTAAELTQCWGLSFELLETRGLYRTASLSPHAFRGSSAQSSADSSWPGGTIMR